MVPIFASEKCSMPRPRRHAGYQFPVYTRPVMFRSAPHWHPTASLLGCLPERPAMLPVSLCSDDKHSCPVALKDLILLSAHYARTLSTYFTLIALSICSTTTLPNRSVRWPGALHLSTQTPASSRETANCSADRETSLYRQRLSHSARRKLQATTSSPDDREIATSTIRCPAPGNPASTPTAAAQCPVAPPLTNSNRHAATEVPESRRICCQLVRSSTILVPPSAASPAARIPLRPQQPVLLRRQSTTLTTMQRREYWRCGGSVDHRSDPLRPQYLHQLRHQQLHPYRTIKGSEANQVLLYSGCRCVTSSPEESLMELPGGGTSAERRFTVLANHFKVRNN